MEDSLKMALEKSKPMAANDPLLAGILRDCKQETTALLGSKELADQQVHVVASALHDCGLSGDPGGKMRVIQQGISGHPLFTLYIRLARSVENNGIRTTGKNITNKLLGESISQSMFVFPLFVWLCQLIAVIVVVYAAVDYLPHGPFQKQPLGDQWLQGFSAWDGGWYLSIARDGYTTLQSTAFFPFYPLMIRYLSIILGLDPLFVGMIISNLALLVAMYFLYRLTAEYVGIDKAQLTIVLLTVFPTSFYYHAVYTESMTLMTTVLFFWFLKHDRWYPAMTCGFFATGIHDLGAVLAFPAIYHLWQQRHQFPRWQLRLRFFSISIIGWSLLGHMAFLYLTYGNGLSFMEAQSYWSREPVIPVLSVFIVWLRLLLHPGDWNYNLIMVVNGVLTMTFFWLGLKMLYRKNYRLPVGVSVFFWATFLLSIISGTGGDLQSFGRYMAVIFPGFIIWAMQFRSGIRFWITAALLFGCKLILLALFVNGYWIT